MIKSQEYNKNYYLKNKERINSRRKVVKKVLPEEVVQAKKMAQKKKHDDYMKNYFNNTDYQKNYLRKKRLELLELLGNMCIRCGFNNVLALQIDHINGGGSKERKELGFSGSFYSNVVRSVLNKENKYQLLCANCNWIKRHENKECYK